MYRDCEIPAKLFFKISNTGDYTLLGEGTPEEQAQAFYEILDEFYQLDKANKMGNSYAKQARIDLLQLWIKFIETCLYSICYTPMTVEERLQVIEEMNGLDGANVKFNVDAPVRDEVFRIQKKVLTYLRNELRHATATTQENKQTEQDLISFERELANISVNLKISVPSSITLKEFVAYRITNRDMMKAYKNTNKNG